MAAIARRSHMAPIPASVELATADDLDGTLDNTQAFDFTGASRVLLLQVNNGTLGTAGIDVLEISHDGGENWAAADKVLALASNDATGTELNGILNAAGVEPADTAVFKCGPYEGPTALRIGRKTTDSSGTTWVTGAPTVLAIAIGMSAAPVALA